MKKLFLDANVLVDYMNVKRNDNASATALIAYCLKKEIVLCTSCDIITTLYYVDSKNDKNEALNSITTINRFVKIIEFANHEVARACELMSQGGGFTDLEDTIQYVLAAKEKCELIISNDKRFFSPDIELVGSLEFCDRYGALK